MPATDRSPITVLHVDDDSRLLDLTAEFLEGEGNSLGVVTELSAEDGLDRLETEATVDCIVSDFEMPGMNGIEFLEAVREDHPELPFILFTGKGSEAVASEAIAAGVTDYLQKETGTSQYTVLANRIQNAVAQRRAARAVDETERRYRRLIEESSDVICVVDAHGEYDYVSPAADRVLGYSSEELVGENGFEYVHPDDRAGAMKQFEEVAQNPGDRITAEFRFERSDGGWTWVEVRGRNLLDDPIIDGIVVYARDITARKAD